MKRITKILKSPNFLGSAYFVNLSEAKGLITNFVHYSLEIIHFVQNDKDEVLEIKTWLKTNFI